MESNGPLSGLTVVELGHSVAAPFGGQTLAILGARVIKVENPINGDDARSWGPPFWEGASACFQSLNREKLSITVDFKDAEQLEDLKRLIDEYVGMGKFKILKKIGQYRGKIYLKTMNKILQDREGIICQAV